MRHYLNMLKLRTYVFSEWNIETYSALTSRVAWICRRRDPLAVRSRSADGMITKLREVSIHEIYIRVCKLKETSKFFYVTPFHSSSEMHLDHHCISASCMFSYCGCWCVDRPMVLFIDNFCRFRTSCIFRDLPALTILFSSA
jgi:hypothetical protein